MLSSGKAFRRQKANMDLLPHSDALFEAEDKGTPPGSHLKGNPCLCCVRLWHSRLHNVQATEGELAARRSRIL